MRKYRKKVSNQIDNLLTAFTLLANLPLKMNAEIANHIDENNTQSVMKSLFTITSFLTTALCFSLFCYNWTIGNLTSINNLTMAGIFMIYTIYHIFWTFFNMSELMELYFKKPFLYTCVYFVYFIPINTLVSFIFFELFNLEAYITKIAYYSVYAFFSGIHIFAMVYLATLNHKVKLL